MKNTQIGIMLCLGILSACNKSIEVSTGPSNDPIWKIDCNSLAPTKEFGGSSFKFSDDSRSGIGWFEKGIDAIAYLGGGYNPVSEFTGPLSNKIDAGNGIPLPEGLTVFQGNNVEPSVLCQNGKVVAYRDYFTGSLDKLNSFLQSKYGGVLKQVKSYNGEVTYESREKSSDKFVMTRINDLMGMSVVIHIYYFKPELIKFWQDEMNKLASESWNMTSQKNRSLNSVIKKYGHNKLF